MQDISYNMFSMSSHDSPSSVRSAIPSLLGDYHHENDVSPHKHPFTARRGTSSSQKYLQMSSASAFSKSVSDPWNNHTPVPQLSLQKKTSPHHMRDDEEILSAFNIMGAKKNHPDLMSGAQPSFGPALGASPAISSSNFRLPNDSSQHGPNNWTVGASDNSMAKILPLQHNKNDRYVSAPFQQPSNNGVFESKQRQQQYGMFSPPIVPDRKLIRHEAGFNPSAPEFRPSYHHTSTSKIKVSETAPPPSVPSMARKLSNANGRNTYLSAAMRGVPESGIELPNPIKTPDKICPMPPSAKRGTSSSQAKFQSKQKHMIQTVYNKLVTCQSGKCRRRHECIMCNDCNSLFCEECSQIKLQTLLFDRSEDSEEEAWEAHDLHRIPGMCACCGGQRAFKLNLAMMKVVSSPSQYHKFALLYKEDACNGNGQGFQ